MRIIYYTIEYIKNNYVFSKQPDKPYINLDSIEDGFYNYSMNIEGFRTIKDNLSGIEITWKPLNGFDY